MKDCDYIDDLVYESCFPINEDDIYYDYGYYNDSNTWDGWVNLLDDYDYEEYNNDLNYDLVYSSGFEDALKLVKEAIIVYQKDVQREYEKLTYEMTDEVSKNLERGRVRFIKNIINLLKYYDIME